MTTTKKLQKTRNELALESLELLRKVLKLKNLPEFQGPAERQAHLALEILKQVSSDGWVFTPPSKDSSPF